MKCSWTCIVYVTPFKATMDPESNCNSSVNDYSFIFVYELWLNKWVLYILLDLLLSDASQRKSIWFGQDLNCIWFPRYFFKNLHKCRAKCFVEACVNNGVNCWIAHGQDVDESHDYGRFKLYRNTGWREAVCAVIECEKYDKKRKPWKDEDT